MVRASLYMATVASWLWLIPSSSAIRASAAVGKPHFWTTPATIKTFALAYAGFSARTTAIGLAFTFVALIYLRRRRSLVISGMRTRLPVLLVTASLFLIPVVFALESLMGPSLFNERYMQPVEIALAFGFCELFEQVSDASSAWFEHPSLEPFAWLALIAMVLHYDMAYLPRYINTHSDYTSRLISHLPLNVPILCEDAFAFTELMGREASSGARFMYLLDWQQSVSRSAPRLEVTQFHLMENWKRVGYFADRIAYRQQFLAETPYFLVLHTEEHDDASLLRAGDSSFRNKFVGNPLADRFAHDPGFSTMAFADQNLGKLRESETLVCHRGIDCGAILLKLKSNTSLSPSFR
jgi:hypothetical protein